jgi:putative glycosyltransferase (TIGR04348 family)
MRIVMVTPAPPRSRAGNRATALRWANFLRELGLRVTLTVAYDGAPFDLMIALHAWRSAQAIATFAERYPTRPLVVALTGTDLYRFIHSHPGPTLRSIELGDRLVALHDLAYRALPRAYWPKVRVIYQSAQPLRRRLPPRKRTFDVCVVGHLRDEKDSLRAALAVRELPASSRLRIVHYGKPHDESWASRARAEMRQNPRYQWLGELANWRVREAYARCRAMVMSSNMEGGANVVSEAVVAGLPVIASEIPGNVGLLGEAYPGYYPVGDTEALRALLLRAETDPAFLPALQRHCEGLAERFTPAREREGWRTLLQDLAVQ